MNRIPNSAAKQIVRDVEEHMREIKRANINVDYDPGSYMAGFVIGQKDLYLKFKAAPEHVQEFMDLMEDSGFSYKNVEKLDDLKNKILAWRTGK